MTLDERKIKMSQSMAKNVRIDALVLAMLGTLLLALAIVFALPRPASAAETLVADKTVTVRESDFDVDTGVDVRTGDRLVVSASGQIWAGDRWFGNNGPQGFDWIDCANKFPLPCSHPYSLLGKLNGNYFYIGSGIDRVHNGGDSRLSLRINDDVPANGNGSFEARVQVYRQDAPPVIVDPRPAPGAKIKDRTPTIRVLVRDDITELTKSDISLSLDGRSVTTFSYDQATDRLTYTPTSKLSFGRHAVEIKATDQANQSTNKVWGFRIVR
jgi:hypothetical protein